MKKIIGLFIATILLALTAPVGLAQASNTSTASPDYIDSIFYDKSATTNFQNSSSTLSYVEANKVIPIYNLRNGEFVKSTLAVFPNTETPYQATVITKSGRMFYQIGDNQYIESNLENMTIGTKFTIPATIQQ